MAQATVCIHQYITCFGHIICIQHNCRINQKYVDCIHLFKKKGGGVNNLCQVEVCLQCDCCSALQPVLSSRCHSTHTEQCLPLWHAS